MEESASKKELSKTEYNRMLTKQAAEKKGLTLQEYRKWVFENMAKKRGLTAQEYMKERVINSAKKKGLTVQEYNRQVVENMVKKKGMTVPEYYKKRKSDKAKELGISVHDYNKLIVENTAKRAGFRSACEYTIYNTKCRKYGRKLTMQEFYEVYKPRKASVNQLIDMIMNNSDMCNYCNISDTCTKGMVCYGNEPIEPACCDDNNLDRLLKIEKFAEDNKIEIIK